MAQADHPVEVYVPNAHEYDAKTRQPIVVPGTVRPHPHFLPAGMRLSRRTGEPGFCLKKAIPRKTLYFTLSQLTHDSSTEDNP